MSTWKYPRFHESGKAGGDGSGKREEIRRQRFKKSQNRFTGQSVSMRNMGLYDAIYVSGDKRSRNRWRRMVIGPNPYWTTYVSPPPAYLSIPDSLDKSLPRTFCAPVAHDFTSDASFFGEVI